MTEPQKTTELVPRCPVCKTAIRGLNISGLVLPMPDGRKLNFIMPCCPNIECSVILGVQLLPDVQAAEAGAPPPPPASGLWTPPGRGN
jgi:hypothetical protein